MKNIRHIFSTTIISLVILTSLPACVYNDREVKFYGADQSKPTQIYPNLKLVVIDGRSNREKLGTKEFGSQKVKITNYQNVKLLIENKISRALFDANLKIKTQKSLEVYLIKFKYDSMRGIKGLSTANVVMKVVVRDANKRAVFRKKYKLDLEQEYFVSSAIKDDERNINAALEKSLQKIVTDGELINIISQ